MARLLALLETACEEAATRSISEVRSPITPLDEYVSYVKWARQVRRELEREDIWYVIKAQSLQDGGTTSLKTKKNILVATIKDNAKATNIILKHTKSQYIASLSLPEGLRARELWEALRKKVACPNCIVDASAVSVQSYKSSSLRCPYCKLLLEAIDKVYPGWTSGPARTEMKFVYVSDVRLSCLSQPYIQLRLAGEGLTGVRFDDIEIRLETGLSFNPSMTSLNSLTRVLDDYLTWNIDPRGSLSRREWENVAHQIQDCVSFHRTCRTPNPRFSPKRLVQVHLGDSSIRLIERKSLNGPKYCALSYCWGSQNARLTTTRENLEKHREGISLSLVPQV
jgi:hypothetical protein